MPAGTLGREDVVAAVTGAGAVGYESGNQNDTGKMAALMPNATTSMRCSTSCVSCGSSDIRSAI